jgi:hypothetical protein
MLANSVAEDRKKLRQGKVDNIDSKVSLVKISLVKTELRVKTGQVHPER